MNKVLIYGAYGYTGRLITEEFINQGISPFIAGRNREKLEAFADIHGLEFETIKINEKEKLEAWLDKGNLVIHCAGPFIHTAKLMVEACIKTNTHYLDITGEYQVFDLVQNYSEQAHKKEIMLMPGAGFDVVPSDCLANHLKDQLPAATHLELAFTSKGDGLSRGTTKTMIENLGHPQVYRKDGIYAYSKMGNHCMNIDFGDFSQLSMGISWGDISSAYFSTGIPNIEVYSGTTQEQIAKVKKLGLIGFLVRTDFFRSFLLNKLERETDGPSEDRRENAAMFLWGEVTDGNNTKTAHLTTPNGYTLTAKVAVLITQKILKGNFSKGFQTPSTAYGSKLILEVDDCHFS